MLGPHYIFPPDETPSHWRHVAVWARFLRIVVQRALAAQQVASLQLTDELDIRTAQWARSKFERDTDRLRRADVNALVAWDVIGPILNPKSMLHLSQTELDALIPYYLDLRWLDATTSARCKHVRNNGELRLAFEAMLDAGEYAGAYELVKGWC